MLLHIDHTFFCKFHELNFSVIRNLMQDVSSLWSILFILPSLHQNEYLCGITIIFAIKTFQTMHVLLLCKETGKEKIILRFIKHKLNDI